MNQQQGDELIEALARATGLNPVRCAEHVAISEAWGDAMNPPEERFPCRWSLDEWRASNAAQTMAVMTEAPALDERSKAAARMVEALAKVPTPEPVACPFPFFSARDSVRAVMADGKARDLNEVFRAVEVAFASLLNNGALTSNQCRAVVSALEDFVDHGEMAASRVAGQETMYCWRTSPRLELPIKVLPEVDAQLRDRLVAEAAFRHFRDCHPAATGREVGIFFDAYKAGWNAARAQQNSEVKA